MRASATGFLVSSTLLFFAVACAKSGDDAGAAGSAGMLSAGTAGAGTAGAGSAGAGSGLLECDPSKVLCKRTAPQCVFGEVPQVVDGCYGERVKVERCACSTAAQCPQPDQYTCWAQTHCGPFVH